MNSIMQPRISLMTLGVADLDRAVAFYENVVGWKASERLPGVAFFDLGGLILSLFPHSELAKDADVAPSETGTYHGFALAYNARSAAEVDEIMSGLRERGATIVKEPQAAFWGGYSGYFSDVDGHHWEVAHNPFWTVLEDGRISMTISD